MQRFLKVVRNAKISQSDEKCEDFLKDDRCKYFSKWFCCNGQPAQVKNEKISQRGEECEDFSKW